MHHKAKKKEKKIIHLPSERSHRETHTLPRNKRVDILPATHINMAVFMRCSKVGVKLLCSSI